MRTLTGYSVINAIHQPHQDARLREDSFHRIPLHELAIANLVRSIEGWGGVDILRAKHLLESSFKKTLMPGYFWMAAERVLINGDYEGMAVMKRIGGTPYLDKLAVDPKSKGKGIGKALLETAGIIYPAMIWRAKPDNPAACWYERMSDGQATDGGWTVFWRGLAGDKAHQLVETVVAFPETFLKNAKLGLDIAKNDNH